MFVFSAANQKVAEEKKMHWFEPENTSEGEIIFRKVFASIWTFVTFSVVKIERSLKYWRLSAV